ncbi:MAG: asparaginase [Oscillibacter sp.]|nr:asparaginase [Oscillibacter sp.]
MNIFLVLTGGTICTSVRDGLRSLDTDAASLRLVETFRKSDSPFAASARFTVGERFHTLSENMTVSVWNRMVDYLRRVDFSAFDGVIVAHGTDTLAYTASMFALLLAGCGVPVVFVSSNAPLEHGDARANGHANFRAAAECIGYGIAPGVYVTYRNITDRRMWLHYACRLKQCGDYSEDFHSVGALDITELSPVTLSAFPATAAPDTPLLRLLDAPLSDCVLHIRPYVGIRYDAYRVESFRAVLHGTYHSGTACANDTPDAYGPGSVRYLLDRCADAGTDLYLSPAWNQGELYDTVPVILNHTRNGRRVIPLRGMSAETAYCKLLLYYSCAAVRERIPDFLTCDFCGEMIE